MAGPINVSIIRRLHCSNTSYPPTCCVGTVRSPPTVSHKTGLVEKGVLETALRCLGNDKWPHVHFKCLGIARLLVSLQGKTSLTHSLIIIHFDFFFC